MKCPKCGFEQPDGLECQRCGIIFSRYHENVFTTTRLIIQKSCESCGAVGSIAPAIYHQTIGAVVTRFDNRVEGSFCSSCHWIHFLRLTAITALLGWFALDSALLTPVFILMNAFNLVRARIEIG